MTAEYLLAQPNSSEVIEWLRGGKPGGRTLGELPTTDDSVVLAEELYSLGADRVTAVEIDRYETGDENTGKLVISLPLCGAARARIFNWSATNARQLGFDPDQDTGQKYLFIMLD
jgi:hypothetical protein